MVDASDDGRWAARTCQNRLLSSVQASSEGYYIPCRNILSDRLPYRPYDVQIEGTICKLLDGIDTFAILRTGMGKTGFLCMYMLVLLEILKCPYLCPSAAKRFPDTGKPCLLIVLPIEYLERRRWECVLERIWNLKLEALRLWGLWGVNGLRHLVKHCRRDQMMPRIMSVNKRDTKAEVRLADHRRNDYLPSVLVCIRETSRSCWLGIERNGTVSTANASTFLNFLINFHSIWHYSITEGE